MAQHAQHNQDESQPVSRTPVAPAQPEQPAVPENPYWQGAGPAYGGDGHLGGGQAAPWDEEGPAQGAQGSAAGSSGDGAGGTAAPSDGESPRAGAPTYPLNPNAKPVRNASTRQGLSALMKLMLFALGFIGGIFGLLIVMFLFRNYPGQALSDALKWVVIGMVAAIVFQMIVIQQNGGIESILGYYGLEGSSGASSHSQGSAF